MKIFAVFTLLLVFVIVQNTQAQSNPYPNELNGYEFFGKGKLKGLILGFSKIEDVEKIFGKDCGIKCDYDENWTVNFTYLGNVTKFSCGIAYVLDPIYLGKLYSIKLRPKTNFSHKEIIFSSEFKQAITFPSSSDPCTLCSHCNHNSCLFSGNKDYWMNIHRIYIDKYGLSYTVFDKVLEDSSKNVEKRPGGDLISIEYGISDELEKKMFLEKECSDTICKSICL